MKMRILWACYLFGVLLSLEIAQAQVEPLNGPEEAMQQFARLLRIPPEVPACRAVSTSVEPQGDVILEDLSWASLDGEQVPAYLIRPREGKGPFPAVICLHGSSGSRESMIAEPFGIGDWKRFGSDVTHQRLLGWARQLARSGFVTLSITQRGLDHRLPNTNDRAKDVLVHGRTLMGEIVQEIRQGISYLEGRPDVDPSRIGVGGLSFGGITSFYTWLADDRIAAVSSICGGVGSVETLLREGSPGYHGFYWWIPDMLTRGDQGDFAAAMAPRPLMIWAPLQDIGMPASGVESFLNAVEPAYRRKNGLQFLSVHRPPGEHAFSLEAFSAMRRFFTDQLVP
ncbi:MAG: hypothetical protein JSU96_18385 [Acidobacteriota bacterium]|nr:MAG: hypothetical protein JSU96_18385 [Acidobacteriota bacterium]